MDKKVKTISEEALRNIIKEAVKEIFNSPNRDALGTNDGRYIYQGTGSAASKERVSKLNKGAKSPSYVRPGKGGNKSSWDMFKKEMGGLNTAPLDKSGKYWNMFIAYLRDLASKNYSDGRAQDMVNYCTKSLSTKEGAKSFIKYLYSNGFKDEKLV